MSFCGMGFWVEVQYNIRDICNLEFHLFGIIMIFFLGMVAIINYNLVEENSILNIYKGFHRDIISFNH
jgi:hypothetical protein